MAYVYHQTLLLTTACTAALAAQKNIRLTSRGLLRYCLNSFIFKYLYSNLSWYSGSVTVNEKVK